MNARPTVFVVDDDAGVRDALTMLLEVSGHDVAAFAGAEEFLAVATPNIRGCIILDVDMFGMDGPTLQEELLRRGVQLPVIFLSGYGNIPTIVRTIKAGAMDFLIKPVDGSVLLSHVQKALAQHSILLKQSETYQSVASRLSTLSEREREVMTLAVAGHTSKEIAQHLGISYRTVEIHRAHVMQKTSAANLLELARLVGVLKSNQTPLKIPDEEK